jgi:DNA-binding transcriptional regulator YhcF (GntR family)
MLRIQHNSPVPIYEQLIARIEELIRSGQLRAGDALPSIRQLASQVDVAINTVARAYQDLERKGLVTSNGRKGTHVRAAAPAEAESTADFKAVILDLFRQGLDAQQIKRSFDRSMQQIFS